jgi:hypothetical protein
VKFPHHIRARRTGTALIVAAVPAAATFMPGAARGIAGAHIAARRERGLAPQLAGSAGPPGQIFNPGCGLGVPDLAALAADFGRY